MPDNRPRNPSIRRLANRLTRLFDRHLDRIEQEAGLPPRRTLPDRRPFPRRS